MVTQLDQRFAILLLVKHRAAGSFGNPDGKVSEANADGGTSYIITFDQSLPMPIMLEIPGTGENANAMQFTEAAWPKTHEIEGIWKSMQPVKKRETLPQRSKTSITNWYCAVRSTRK